MEDMERLRKKISDNRISLNEDTRRHEVDEEKTRKETRSKERLARNTEEPSIYRLTLETVDNPKLELIMYPGKIAEAKKGDLKTAPEAAPDADDLDDDSDTGGDDSKPAAVDPERDETLNILSDLVQLSAGPKTASTTQTSR
jgi:hypothetical protein